MTRREEIESLKCQLEHIDSKWEYELFHNVNNELRMLQLEEAVWLMWKRQNEDVTSIVCNYCRREFNEHDCSECRFDEYDDMVADAIIDWEESINEIHN